MRKPRRNAMMMMTKEMDTTCALGMDVSVIDTNTDWNYKHELDRRLYCKQLLNCIKLTYDTATQYDDV